MSTKKKLLELLREAEKSKDDSVILQAHKSFVEQSREKPFADVSEESVSSVISRFTNYLTQKYQAVGIQFSQLPETSQTLMKWMVDISSKTTPEKIVDCKDPVEGLTLTFDEVAGQQEVKADLEKNYIYPFIFPMLFSSRSKGIMLYGPPGTGKTMLAKAATAELPGAAFFAPTPGELRGKYEGETEKNISNVFNCAQQIVDDPKNKYTFAIIFLDEFDSLAGSRGDDQGMRRSVNALLQAMDGMKELKNVSVIAATNYPWTIDEAVLRRFSARIFVDLPDGDAREWLIREAISKNYSLPSKPMKSRSKNLIRSYDASTGFVAEWDESAFATIHEYGNRYCSKDVEAGWFGGSSQIEDTRVTSEYIEEVIRDKTGPNDEARKLKDRIAGIGGKAGEYVDPDTIDDETTSISFGYSASDVSKMMTIAVQDASFRALNGGFAEQKIGRETYYVAVPKDDNFAKYAAIPEVVEDTKLKLLTKKQKLKTVNFSLCQEDIERAITKYPPTVRTTMYIKLLNYKYHGIAPN